VVRPLAPPRATNVVSALFERRVEDIEHDASRWLAARDAGATSPEQTAEFNRWLEADIRHRVAYLRLEAHWKRIAKLKELRPLDRGIDPDLLKARTVRRTWPFAIAASLLVALAAGGFWYHQQRYAWQTYETRVGVFSRVVLEDGSVVDLNTNSEVRVRLGAARREVRLTRGEGRFKVAHDVNRPFVVAANDTAVRAVGTAFTVRLRDASEVEVVVAEGKVAIAAPRVAEPAPLAAGEAAVVQAGHVSVSQVSPQALERRLAWTGGRLAFRGEPLANAVAEFNRYNLRQIRLANPALGALRVGGNFKATDPESFAAALASAFKLHVDPAGPDAIVLRPP
jgi:transmembrane sensor